MKTMKICPGCKKMLDASTCVSKVEKKKPVPGDFSICFHCLKILRFDDNLLLRGLTQQEHIDLVNDAATWAEILKTRRALEDMHTAIKAIEESLSPRDIIQFITRGPFKH